MFLDRDGVLNRAAAEGDYIKSPQELELIDGAVEAVKALNNQGLLVLVVTNQRGIALGRMTAQDLEQVHHELRARLAAGGARLDGIYHCPHQIGTCGCRKPDIGLFLRARRDHPGIDFARSTVIGDSVSDMTAARRIGARAILLSEQERDDFECAASLLKAARMVARSEP